MTDQAKTLQERRRELLRQRIADSGLAAAPARPDQPAIRAGEQYPLSAGQRRMWFVQAMDPGDTTLNICVAYRLTGPLDQQRLRAAFGDVVARHAILRTTYGVDPAGEPYQEFRDGVEIAWHEHDLSGRSEQLESVAHAEFDRAFDLTGELPLRVTLVRTGAEDFVLLLAVHHICWDDDCWSVFFGELSMAYNARQLTGQPAQFVAVEVLGTRAEPAAADIDYWRRALRPLPEPLELPGAAVANPSRRARRRTRGLPAELLGRVEEFARQRSATPFMVLLAAFGALVQRYTGASDFLVSVPVTDRTAAAENAIGYFGNTLLLRIAPTEQHTFAALVDAVRETCLDGFAHQSVGVDRVVREANPARVIGRDGTDHLVRLGFSMRKSASGLTFDGIAVRHLELGAVSAPVPLSLAVVPDEGLVEFEYQTDLLGDAFVDQMLGHYLQLLDTAVREPAHRVARLEMLTAAERAATLAQSHGEIVETPASTLVALLDAAVAAAPDAIAVVADDAELSYADLHRRANRLARWLIGQDIGAEDVVGLPMAGSVDFVVAALAVLKSGAAYLPIDPTYPADRIDYLITDTGPALVIGPQQLVAAEHAASALPDGPVTDTDRIRPLHPDHLAYVIYTSGSTGRPKGVAVAHRAIAEHLQGFRAEWSMTAADRLLPSASVSFDASLAEIFLTLSVGAALIVPDLRAFDDFGYLAELIDRHRVTVLQMVPSTLRTLLALPPVRQWRQLRHVPVGGEALPAEVADAFAGHFDAELRNHYGPTEAVVCATHQPVADWSGTGVVPIGRPNRNVYSYVLDRQLQPVPAGVVGELYLGGVQLARGYFRRPALTAQRFIADPFNPGLRLFRSGDLVRRNLSGELEFVGRADEQVKIRGFRIELGEIEAVISAHPAVRQCVVVAEDGGAGAALAAYLVPAAELDVDQIRAHAASLLPEYMVPSGFAVLAEIPLTVGGKLDKQSLPAPTRIATGGYRAPATATERRVCEIFTQLFGGERVGTDDSFFELGGHSLLAARLVAQIRADFGVELPVRTVFDTPTPAGLAAGLVARFRSEFDIDLDELDADDPVDSTEPGGPTRPALLAAARPDRLPLSYSQLAAWFQHRLEGAHDGFNLPLALRFDGPLDADALRAALGDVVARHEALRTSFAEYDGVPCQRVHPQLTVELATQQVSADQVDQAMDRLRREVLAPESAPLLRATLLAVDQATHLLFVNLHHIVADHASLGAVFDDLITAYRARRSGGAPQWGMLPVQFADYALWQREAFDGEWGQAQVAHWRSVLAGLPDDTTVAADHPRPQVLGKRGRIVHFTVSAALRASVLQLAESTGATEFMVYQAALAVLLHKLGGGTDLAVGSTVAARVDTATANLVGMFANVVVLRNDLSGDPSLRTVLTRSRDTVLDAVAHQELPIERLVEAINPPRSLSRNPLFQHMVHFRGPDWGLQPRDLTGIGETTVTPRAIDFDIALLDLDIGMNVTAAGELAVRVVANADLYDAPTVDRIAEALHAVLTGFAETPDRPVSQLVVLPEEVLAALRAVPDPTVAATSEPAGAGSAETERILIELLEELLDITGVDREDNFFALGGDSIISIKWSAQATARGRVFTPAMVFAHMTIAELAAAVDNGEANGDAEAATDTADQPYTPMSASGLDADALAALTASWQQQS